VELPEALEGLQENDDLLESFELDNSVELLQDMHGSYLLTDETAVENVMNHQRGNVVPPNDMLLLNDDYLIMTILFKTKHIDLLGWTLLGLILKISYQKDLAVVYILIFPFVKNKLRG